MFRSNTSGEVSLGYLANKTIQTKNGEWSFITGSFTKEDVEYMMGNLDDAGRFRFKITARKEIREKSPTHNFIHDTWKPDASKAKAEPKQEKKQETIDVSEIPF